jgi:uncharacterized protein DUF4166
VTVHGSGAEISTLYPRLLGSAWSNVAEAVRGVHAERPVARMRGRVRVTNGPAPLARILARMLCLPRPGDAVDTRLVVNAAAGEEQWVRTFDGRRLDTNDGVRHPFARIHIAELFPDRDLHDEVGQRQDDFRDEDRRQYDDPCALPRDER